MAKLRKSAKRLTPEQIAAMPLLHCPKCTGRMRLRPSKYGLFYGCMNYPRCNATHGAHPDGKPLGIPADDVTKIWRIKAHAAFDQLWGRNDHYIDFGTKRTNRIIAYKWLAVQLRIQDVGRECHIARFNVEQCLAVIEACSSVTWVQIRNWYDKNKSLPN